jgi:L-threonylcarbamoyladenylate synthase
MGWINGANWHRCVQWDYGFVDVSTSRDLELLIDRAAELIRGGGVVVVPTETFYALAADPFQGRAVGRIFAIKGRDENKPLPLIASDRSAVEQVTGLPEPIVRRLMDRFWPGSLTILLRPLKSVSGLLAGPTGKIGVRVPPSCPARILAERSGGWITATSANLSGGPDPDNFSVIAPEILTLADLTIDLGPTPAGKPSTVVEPVGADLRIIREGAIPASVLIEFLQSQRLGPNPTDNRP